MTTDPEMSNREKPTMRSRALSGSLVVTLGEGVAQAASFVRNIILARLLTKADFGIAATCAMIITLLELSTKLGVSRLVIQSKEGDRFDFLSTAHLMQFLVAVLGSLVMVATAEPLALLFGLENQRMALYALAAIPLLRGLEHIDVTRFERELRFGPSAMVRVIPQVIITLAAWPLALWLRDYRAILVLLLLRAILSSIASHWLAEHPYRWQFKREYVIRMMRFGWPLLLNGFLMFGVFQGDRFFIAAFYTMTDLGPYAAAATLTLTPTFFFTRVLSSVMLPLMSRAQEDPHVFQKRYRLVIALICAFSAAYSVTMILGAESLMQLVFGQKYAGSGLILAWLSAANAFRVIRIAPAMAAMAKADSGNQLISNIWRVTSLVPALAVAVAGHPIWIVASTGLLGEVLACFASFRRLTRRDSVPWKASLVPTFLVALTMAAAGMIVYLLRLYDMHVFIGAGLAVVGAGFAGSVLLFALKDSRQEALRAWAQLRSGTWKNWLPWRKGSHPVGKPTVA